MTINYNTPQDRFWKKVTKTDHCWFWTARLNNGGYGEFTVNNKRYLAHRFSYEIHKDVILAGGKKWHIDHLCRTRSCVNPDHLELVTSKENILRGIGLPAINANKTQCYRGHFFTYTNKKGQRICNECKVIATRTRRAKFPNIPRKKEDPQKRKARYQSKKFTIITHCKYGHEFSPENTLWFNGRRKCKECRK